MDRTSTNRSSANGLDDAILRSIAQADLAEDSYSLCPFVLSSIRDGSIDPYLQILQVKSSKLIAVVAIECDRAVHGEVNLKCTKKTEHMSISIHQQEECFNQKTSSRAA